MTNQNPLQKHNERRRLEAEAKYPNDKIIELYNSGLKITEVAEIMGCGKVYVRKVLKRNNIPTRNRIFYSHPMDSEEARQKNQTQKGVKYLGIKVLKEHKKVQEKENHIHNQLDGCVKTQNIQINFIL